MNESAFIGQNSCYCAAIESERNQDLETRILIETFDNPTRVWVRFKIEIEIKPEGAGNTRSEYSWLDKLTYELM